tara:strand:- start:202 stop:483 length:282 start_codon:yes stop_codon:yes gene_type:complete
VSKKKSYMDNKNIVKEGFFDSLVKAIVPKSIQKKVATSSKKYYEKEAKRLEKKLKDFEKESAELSNTIAKQLEKQYGYKTNKKKISDFIKKRK